MHADNLQREVQALSLRVAEADGELRDYRERIRLRAANGKPVNDELIQANQLDSVQNQRRALLQELERLVAKSGVIGSAQDKSRMD